MRGIYFTILLCSFAAIANASSNLEKQRFIANETVLLQRPNDQVVLGRITDKALLYEAPYAKYVKSFWVEFEREANSLRRQNIKMFLDQYPQKFDSSQLDIIPSETGLPLSRDDIDALAFDAIDDSDLVTLMALLQNFDILQTARDSIGNSLLARAVLHGNEDDIVFLLQEGIDVNTLNFNNQTPLMLAAIMGNTEMMETLMTAGALGSYRDNFNLTAFDYLN